MNSTQNKEKSSSCNSAVNQRTICQVEIIDFTEDKDLILKVEKGTKDDELELIRYGHDTHFHVRLKCPENSIDCIKQIPTVNELSDDRYGCDETLNWWVTEFLGPKKPLTPT